MPNSSCEKQLLRAVPLGKLDVFLSLQVMISSPMSLEPPQALRVLPTTPRF